MDGKRHTEVYSSPDAQKIDDLPQAMIEFHVNPRHLVLGFSARMQTPVAAVCARIPKSFLFIFTRSPRKKGGGRRGNAYPPSALRLVGGILMILLLGRSLEL